MFMYARLNAYMLSPSDEKARQFTMAHLHAMYKLKMLSMIDMKLNSWPQCTEA
jgi:hypothetical protein